MTLRNRIKSAIVRLAAAILAREAKAQQAKRQDIHERLRAELQAGYVGGVKVR